MFYQKYLKISAFQSFSQGVKIGIFLLLFLVCWLTGCSKPIVQHEISPIKIEAGRADIWRICQKELKKRGFSLDIVDYRQGRIKTQPRTSGQWFEPWCHDVVTSEAFWESSLHTIRRIVYIDMKVVGANQCRLSCQVEVERMSGSKPVISGQVRSRDIFGQSIGKIPVLKPGPAEPGYQAKWVSLGDDPALENYILLDIKAAIESYPDNAN